MGLKAAVQAFEKAEQLKAKVVSTRDVYNDKEAWTCQQQLRSLYQQVLTLDLEYALDRKVEQDLWNHCFKNTISVLQALAKDKKNPRRGEYQAMLTCHLEDASGFYLTLLQTMCMAFNLDLPFIRKGSMNGESKLWKVSDYVIRPHKNSSTYICQHCLVHLGDLARYGNRNKQAEAFYRHAVRVSPNSGQPYNQLALLETSRGDTLSTVFHYVRSIAVKSPFPAATTNLSLTFAKCVEERSYIETRTKLSTSEYISTFLRLHGLFHSGAEAELTEKLVGLLATTLTAHVATESLTSWKLIQMLAINLFSYHYTKKNSEERRIKRLVLDLIASSLSTFLLPVYTLKESDNLLDYFALPAIKLTLDWIRFHPTVLSDSAFASRLQIWPSLCKLLNGLNTVVDLFTPDEYSYMPLPEDRELQGFLPLEKTLSNLRFSWNSWDLKQDTVSKVRAHRLLEFGNWLTTREGLIIKRLSVEGSLSFEAVGGQQIPPSELIRELEELSLNKLPSPVPSDTGSSATGNSSPTSLEAQIDFNLERRTGILKLQASIESKEPNEWSSPPAPSKRSHQNVAIQAIMRRGKEQETAKQTKVTFKTPSPSLSPHSSQSTDDSSLNKPSMASVWNATSFGMHNREPATPPTPEPPVPILPDFSVPPPNFPFPRFPPPPIPTLPPSNDFVPRSATGQSNINQTASNLWLREDHSRQWAGHRSAVPEAIRQPPPNNMFSAFSIPPPKPLVIDDKTWSPKQQSPSHNSPGISSVLNSPPLFSTTPNTYSLFSAPSWNSQPPSYKLGVTGVSNTIGQQSLWSGPGPSPLERLLEQQKQLREGPAPKGGT